MVDSSKQRLSKNMSEEAKSMEQKSISILKSGLSVGVGDCMAEDGGILACAVEGNICTWGVPSFSTFLGLARRDCKACRGLTCDEEEEKDYITCAGFVPWEVLFNGAWRISQRASIWHVMIGWEWGQAKKVDTRWSPVYAGGG